MKRGISPFSDVIAIIKLMNLFRRIRPAIVHSHTPKAGLVGMMAAWLTGVPIRMHTVAGMPLESRAGLSRGLLLFAERLTYLFAGRIYPNSRGIESIINESRLTVSSKIKMIGKGSSNGIDLNHFSTNDEIEEKSKDIRIDFGIKDDEKVLGFIGRLVKDKGIIELINAFKRLSAKHKCRLVLVGKFEQDQDPLPKEVILEIEQNPLIHFAGYQTDVRPYFASFDIFVFPSYREGLPNVLLQAAAMGLPIVASDCTGNTDIIKHHDNGVLVKVGDAGELYAGIEELITNDELKIRLAKKVESFVRTHYDREVLWRLIEQEYHNLLNE
jgi:glycosyltransferase involved in cell wall biosynthesis